MCVCVLVTQPCSTLCDPMDYKPPGSSVHVNSLGKNTEVGSHSFFQGILDQTWVSCTAVRFFSIWATRETHDLPIPVLCIPAENNTLIQKHTYIVMFIAAIFTIDKTWKQPKCLFFFFFIFTFKDLDIWALLEFSYSIMGFPFLMFSLSF